MKIAYDLKRIGVVNQTTMLAEETIAISNYLRDVVVGVHGPEAYADTRDTLCYATNDNQTATQHLLNNEGVKIAFVVGGFNSSNTLQLATILKKNYLVFYIRGESDIIDKNIIRHFNFENMSEELTQVDWLSEDFKKFIITSGASCPDSIMDSVIRRIADCRNSLDSLDLSVKNLLAEE
jgi:4-hydroxy-3-methylbut-2-enyl diphosphate reductase